MAFPPRAAGNEGSAAGLSERSILLIESKHDQALGFENLRVALEAHLGSNSIDVRLYQINKLPRRSSSQITSVREIAERLSISAAIWIDIQRKMMWLIFTDHDGNERLLKRKFTCISHNMRGCVDAIGSKVTSALSSWIGMKPLSPNRSLRASSKEASGEPVIDNELNPIAVGSDSWEEPKPLVHLLLDAGYGFSFFRGSRGFLHGMRFGIGTIWAEHLKFEVSTDVVLPIESDSKESGARTEINRWPIRILAGGVIPWKNWTFALALGLAIDLMSYRKVSSDPFFDGVDFVNQGFSTSVTVRYFLEDWFAVWVDLGVDIYESDFDSDEHGDREVSQQGAPMHCGSVLASVTIGVAFGWKFFRDAAD